MVARPPRHRASSTAAPPVARWILFMPTIPPRPASVRVRIWRRLQAIGAINLRGAVYVLPNREDCVELFEWLGRELTGLGGQAALCEGRFLDRAIDDDIARRFTDARNADFAVIASQARALAGKLAGKRVTADRIAAIADQHARLAQRLAEATAIDYLAAPGRIQAESLIAALGRGLARDTPRAHEPELPPAPRPRGATWVTRSGVHVDRIASAWLIRRFIDPKARFKFVAATRYAPAAGELRFDMFDAEFTHVGDRCTFEVLVARMAPRDPALVAIGEIIHDLDLRDGKFARDEAAGLRSALDGICATTRDDARRIADATAMLDGLHAHFTQRARRGGRAAARQR